MSLVFVISHIYFVISHEKSGGWLGGIDVKWFFLSYHEIIWNKNRIFAHSIINKNDRNEETDSYDYGNISHDGSLGSGTAIP